jgi:hypothetical protein
VSSLAGAQFDIVSLVYIEECRGWRMMIDLGALDDYLKIKAGRNILLSKEVW